MSGDRQPIDIRSRSADKSRELSAQALWRVVRSGRSVLVLTDLDLRMRRIICPGATDPAFDSASLVGESILSLFHTSEHEFLAALLDRRRGAEQFDVRNLLVESAADEVPSLYLTISTIVGSVPDHTLVTWRISTSEQPPMFDDFEDMRATMQRRITALQSRVDVHRLTSENARRSLSAAMETNGALYRALQASRTIRDQHVQALRESNQRMERMYERLRKSLESTAEARRSAEEGRKALGFMADASRELSASLDFDTTLQRVANLALPRLGGCCIVDLVDDGSNELRHAHVSCEDPDLVARFEGYPEFPLAGQADADPLRRVLASGRSVVMHASNGSVAAPESGPGYFLIDGEAYGFTSCLIAALRSQDQVFGTMTFVSNDPSRRYEPEDLDFAEDIALRSGQALDNAMLYRAAADAAKSRERYLAMASHELRSPLAVVSGFGSLLVRALRNPEPDLERIAELELEIQRGVERLEILTEGLLASSSLRDPMGDPHPSQVNLSRLVGDLIGRMTVAADGATGRRIALESAGEITGVWNEEALERALTNVISNALKYSSESDAVAVVLHATGNVAEIQVRDHGIGMSADELGELFTPFVRGQSARQKASGSGLGLYITKKIVDQFNGEIQVDSEPGTGTTVTIRLPLQQASSNVGSLSMSDEGDSNSEPLEDGAPGGS